MNAHVSKPVEMKVLEKTIRSINQQMKVLKPHGLS